MYEARKDLRKNRSAAFESRWAQSKKSIVFPRAWGAAVASRAPVRGPAYHQRHALASRPASGQAEPQGPLSRFLGQATLTEE